MLESASSLMYYPTDNKEIYKMLGVIGRLNLSVKAQDEIKQMLGVEVYQGILEESINSRQYNFATSLYHYFLEQEEYEIIHKYFELSIGFSHNQTSTILDPFAGEGVWLEMIKNTIKRDEINSNKLYTIANELESNRYKNIVNKGIVDEVYNGSYEELEDIPKGSVSLLLFNPPYGDTNGVRNVLHYLDMILEKEVIHKSNKSENGKMILVIREDDLIEILPTLLTHFDVEQDLIYKVNDKEYKKYKQFVVYATIRNNPLDIKNTNDSLKLQRLNNGVMGIIKSSPKFEAKMYGRSFTFANIPYKRLKESHNMLKEDNIPLSVTNGDGWDWFKELTEIKEVEKEIINKPVTPKIGETANLIASGMINGEMQLEDGAGYHIVAGGMKEQIQQEVIQEENKKGELINKTKTVLYSQPYLNVLINENGKVKIKELEGESELE